MENIDLENMDFETHLEKTKQIIQTLNNHDVNLKDGLKLYKQAQEHLNLANEILESAELELKEVLVQGGEQEREA